MMADLEYEQSLKAETDMVPFDYEDEEEEDTYLTKAERRQQKKDKERYGVVKHLDPDLRPKKFNKREK